MTLDDLQSRCGHCPECDTNWRWTGHPNTTPHRVVVQINGKRHPVRRTIFELAKGRPVKKGYCVVSDCADERCMNPELLRDVSKATVLKREIAAGLILHAGHKANVVLARRQRESKLGEQKAMEIYLEDAPTRELAVKHGVTPQAVRNIKNQKNYRYIHNNPFQGLLAANENSKRRA